MAIPGAERSFHTYREIITQADAWRAALAALEAQRDELRGFVAGLADAEVLFVGCGSPFYLALTLAPMLRELAGRDARALPGSELMLFPATLTPARPRLLVALSRSGATTELLEAVRLFEQQKQGPSLAITCYEEGPLAAATTRAVVVPEAREQSLAQTRAWTTMLLAAQWFCFALAGQAPSPRFLSLPDDCDRLLERYHPLAQQLGNDDSFERFFFLGSGARYGMACEAMLKMKEMALSYSEAYHGLEFRHGPMAMVSRRSLVVGLLGEAGLAHELAVLREMRQLGATVLALTPVELAADHVDYQIVLPPGLSDSERAGLYLPLLQLLTLYRTLRKQLNPDQPTNLNYVVELDVDGISDQLAQAVRPLAP